MHRRSSSSEPKMTSPNLERLARSGSSHDALDEPLQPRRIRGGIREGDVAVGSYDVKCISLQLCFLDSGGPGKRVQRQLEAAAGLDESFPRAAIHVRLPL